MAHRFRPWSRLARRALGPAALALAAACSGASPEAQRPLQNATATPPGPRLTALAKLPGIAMERPAWAERDCRLSVVIRARFGAEAVEACGALTDAAAPAAFEAARACVARAIAGGRPFVYEHAYRGVDSNGGVGLVGVRERGELAVYYAHYDDDPCGINCPERGHTTLFRCDPLVVKPKLEACGGSAVFCYECRNELEVSSCQFGGKRR